MTILWTEAQIMMPLTFTDMQSPAPHPIPRLRRFVPPRLIGGSVTSAEMAAGPNGWATSIPLSPPLLQVVHVLECTDCVLMLLRCFFSCSHTVLLTGACHVIFFPTTPCLPVLSTPLSYRIYACMDRLMVNFAGTCD